MNNLKVVRNTSRDLTQSDPERGLQEITVAEASEKHWERAKDTVQLYIAIEAKIRGQADSIVYRDGVVVPSQEQGGPGRGKRVAVLGPVLPEADPGKQIAHRWRKAFCKKQDEITIPDEDKIAVELHEVSKRCARLIEKDNTIRGTEGTGEFERYTPPEYIKAAREVLGEIDLDPASCEMAQQTVKAIKYYTYETDGLKQEWRGRVWMNPPYHRELQVKFINKLVVEIAAGRTTAAVMLTNNSTDTEWFDVAQQPCKAIFFTDGRVKFPPPASKTVAPTQGQAFFYYGSDVEKFAEVFTKFGFGVMPKWKRRKESDYDTASKVAMS